MKQLQALEANRKAAQKQVQNLKAEIGEILAQLEELREASTQLENELPELEKESHAQQARIQEALSQVEIAIRELEEKIQSLRAELPADLLRDFDAILERQGTPVVSVVEDGVCSVCGMELGFYIVDQVLEGEILHCDCCQRFLVPPGGTAPEEASEMGC